MRATGKAVYWDCPEDGATHKCADCAERGLASAMILTQTPNMKRQVLHVSCALDEWLLIASYLGRYTEADTQEWLDYHKTHYLGVTP